MPSKVVLRMSADFGDRDEAGRVRVHVVSGGLLRMMVESGAAREGDRVHLTDINGNACEGTVYVGEKPSDLAIALDETTWCLRNRVRLTSYDRCGISITMSTDGTRETRVVEADTRPADPMGGTLIDHAERELRLAGLYDSDADYGGALALQVMDLIRVFAAQGHSGGSALQTRSIFAVLANGEALTPNDHSLRRDVSKESGGEPGTWLQDIRDSRWISQDGGTTWRNVETGAVEH